jgi:GMP synthase (glutamine-hydrolysing)
LFGVQFHPEVAHTARGREVLDNFVFRICHAEPNWTMEHFIESSIKKIRAQVGDGRVLCALSGGVDSSVAATLIHRAVKDRLDLRLRQQWLAPRDEAEHVCSLFVERFGQSFRYVDATELFLSELKDVEDPEVKRKRIGYKFIQVFEEQARKLGEMEFLAQGTLYPDVIESVSVLGPVGDDQVASQRRRLADRHEIQADRAAARAIQGRSACAWQGTRLAQRDDSTPSLFPGPGLAIRVLGEVTEERLKVLRDADVIVLGRDQSRGTLRKSLAVIRRALADQDRRRGRR